MVKERASVFGDAVDLDLKDFVPKKRSDTKAPSREQVQAIAEAANFPSRQASPQTPKPSKKRAPRIYRTGRNVQFSAKATQETVDAVYTITEANPGWVLGYTLERAVEALQRELELEKNS
jgi:hypothetical protein